MALFIAFLVIAAGGWFWKSRQYDKQTTLDFDAWLSTYEAASSPLKKSRMAVAFLSQSIHFAWAMGAINSKQRDTITSILKGQRAATSVMMLMGSAFPAVVRAIGAEEVPNTPARTVGMLMILAWMSPDNDGENAIRQYLFRT